GRSGLGCLFAFGGLTFGCVVRGAQARRRGEVRDHEVAVDRRLHAVGQRDVVDVDRFADLAAGQVNGDLLGDVGGGHDQFDFRADDDQRATALEAGGGFVVHEFDVDEQV